MKIAIQGHSIRGEEVIQLLESLGGINTHHWLGAGNIRDGFFINNKGIIEFDDLPNGYKLYTLEEFEKEFPFKVGDKVRDRSDDEIGIITDLIYIDNKLLYNVDLVNSGQAFMTTEQLKPYTEMKEKRNIALTLDKAKEWYKKGGELKEIALQAFTENELNSLPRSWEEFVKSTKFTFVSNLEYIDGTGHCSHGCLPNKSIGESRRIWDKHVALFQLEQLRDCWRDGWEPDWGDTKQTKYCVGYYQEKFKITTLWETRCFLSFPTMRMAEEFLECFRDLIEQAGDLI